jgi:hypothetical protein
MALVHHEGEEEESMVGEGIAHVSNEEGIPEQGRDRGGKGIEETPSLVYAALPA